MAAPPLNEAELGFLQTLVQRKVQFMLVGLSAAALQGAPVVTQDVDLWFKDLNDARLRDALQETGVAYVAPSQLNPPMFVGKGVELFDIVLTMDGLESFDQELANCVDIPLEGFKVKVLRLDRILTSKRAANRAKDKLVIPVLADALAAMQSTKRRAAGKKRKRKN